MTLRNQNLGTTEDIKWKTSFQFQNNARWIKDQTQDDLFHVSFIYDNPVGHKIVVETANTDSPQNGSGVVPTHETMSNVIVGWDNYVVSSGAITVFYEWNSGDITSSEVDAYVSWLQTANMGATVENIIKTDTSLSHDFVAGNITGGLHSLIRYQLNAKVTLSIWDANTKIGCFLRPQRKHLDWSTGSYTVAGGETVNVDKQGSDCYVSLVGDGLRVSGVTKDDMSILKLTSDSIIVENTGTETRKIGVIWRD